MANPFVSRVGGVLSADIAVPERAREVRLYARVLGTGSPPLWREDLMNNLGLPIIGLGARNEGHTRLPLQWMPHIQVADVGESVRRALELGGTELMHARGDDGRSHWAVLADPSGAAFGLIPVVPPEMIPPLPTDDADAANGRIGRIASIELVVPDAAAARDFYRQVVGWDAREVEARDGGERYVDHAMLGGDGGPAPALRHARGPARGLPSVWLLHLLVGNLEESLRRAEEEGGRVLHALLGDGGKPTYAVVQDPVGACVALVPA